MDSFIYQTIKKQGIVEFKNVLSLETIEKFNLNIDHLPSNYSYKQFINSVETETMVNELRKQKRYKEVESSIRDVVEKHLIPRFKSTTTEKQKSLLRCINSHSNKESYLEHYDSHIMTILIPLKETDKGDSNGDIVVYYNKRIARSSINNFLSKIYVKFLQIQPKILRENKVKRDIRKGYAFRYKCLPGNVYFLSGYQTKHCNFDVEKGERRVLIIHDYKPQVVGNRNN